MPEQTHLPRNTPPLHDRRLPSEYTKPELIERINKASDAIPSLVDRVRTAGLRVIGVGESHRVKGYGGSDAEFQLHLLQSLVEAGQRVGTIALERDSSFQSAVDAFLRREGELPDEFLRPDEHGFMQGEYFVDILTYARDHGIHVACVDNYPPEFKKLKAEGKIPDHVHPQFLNTRDQDMHDRVVSIVNTDLEAVVLFLVGSSHLSRYTTYPESTRSGYSYRLGETLPTGTYMSVMIQNCAEVSRYVPKVLYTLEDPIFAATDSELLTNFSSKTSGIGYYRDFDATVFVPPPIESALSETS